VFSRPLAEKISPLLDQKLFPLVLGGDCSILLGSALALRRRGRYGLCFIDHSKIEIIEREEIAAKGAQSCARRALERVTRAELAGFWIHLDADVLNASIMPAVDSPNEAGITFAELTGLLHVLLASPRTVGMEVTILDPELDPKGTYAGAFVDALVAGFRGLAAAH
jgi:arginase